MAATQPAVKEVKEVTVKPAAVKPTYLQVKFETDEGRTIGMGVAAEKVFSSGSDGYYCNQRIVVGGVAYQVSCNIVRIHSKPGSK